MIIKILVKLHGGIWCLKHKILNSNCVFLRKLYMFLYYSYLNDKGSYIGHAATFKSTSVFPHGIVGIFISGNAAIGKSSVIFQQVTIGSNTIVDSKNKGAPVIGDNCYIGAGAKIIGSVKIGNNVRIGANCVVTKDVMDNCTVVLSPPRSIEHKNVVDNRFYSIENGKWGY